MRSLENIVASLELCKKIPDGEFEDSALVWETYYSKYSIKPVVIDRKTSESTPHEFVENVYPAPTLEEILDEMVSFRASFCVHGMAIGNNFYGYPTSAEEALLMWLKLKGIEVE